MKIIVVRLDRGSNTGKGEVVDVKTKEELQALFIEDPVTIVAMPVTLLEAARSLSLLTH